MAHAPSLLVGDFGQTEEVALQAFQDGILNSSLVIAVVRVGNDIVSTFVTDTPGSEHACIDAGETLELRYWNGQPWSGQGDGHA